MIILIVFLIGLGLGWLITSRYYTDRILNDEYFKKGESFNEERKGLREPVQSGISTSLERNK